MDTITFEEIKKRASCLSDLSSADTYHKSYKYFIKYFREKKELNEFDFVISANFAYGWMPTILFFKDDDFKNGVKILNKAKGKQRITSEELKTLKSIINNSLVGSSKLLHFVNPRVYAIWDSRVCNFLTGKSYKGRVENIDRYWSYLNLCQKITKDERFAAIHNKFEKKVGYKSSPLRTVEQIMFMCSDKPIRTL